MDTFQSHIDISKPNFPKLSDIFQSWANYEGFPIVNVRYFKDGAKSTVLVSQELFLPNLNSTGESNFIIPYNYLTSVSAEESDWNPALNRFWRSLSAKEENFTLNEQANWILINVQQTGKMQF